MKEWVNLYLNQGQMESNSGTQAEAIAEMHQNHLSVSLGSRLFQSQLICPVEWKVLLLVCVRMFWNPFYSCNYKM